MIRLLKMLTMKIEEYASAVGKHKAVIEVLVAIIGLIILAVQTRILHNQNLMLAKQTDIITAQRKTQVSASQDHLQRTINEIWQLYGRYAGVNFNSQDKQREFGRKLYALLNSEIENPLLVENDIALMQWRNSISISNMMCSPEIPGNSVKMFIDNANQVKRDVYYVLSNVVFTRMRPVQQKHSHFWQNWFRRQETGESGK